jgi:hypothetical protein
LAAGRAHLSVLNQKQQELTRKQKVLDQTYRFVQKAAALELEREDWTFFDVNVQGTFSFQTARQIIEQCKNSMMAYYWPISLEIKTGMQAKDRIAGKKQLEEHSDVELTIKGQFLARQQ